MIAQCIYRASVDEDEADLLLFTIQKTERWGEGHRCHPQAHSGEESKISQMRTSAFNKLVIAIELKSRPNDLKRHAAYITSNSSYLVFRRGAGNTSNTKQHPVCLSLLLFSSLLQMISQKVRGRPGIGRGRGKSSKGGKVDRVVLEVGRERNYHR